jgi:carbonic anhydrase
MNAQSQVLVVALWVDIVPGAKNTVLDSVLAERNWPAVPDSLTGTNIIINLNNLLPSHPRRSQEYYMYNGSLTTPKCTQGVTFLLLKDHIKLSPEKLAFYRTKYNNTFRPTQKLNGRIIQGNKY